MDHLGTATRQFDNPAGGGRRGGNPDRHDVFHPLLFQAGQFGQHFLAVGNHDHRRRPGPPGCRPFGHRPRAVGPRVYSRRHSPPDDSHRAQFRGRTDHGFDHRPALPVLRDNIEDDR